MSPRPMKYDEPTVHLSLRVPGSVVGILDRMPGSRVEALVALVMLHADDFGEQGRIEQAAPVAPRQPTSRPNTPTRAEQIAAPGDGHVHHFDVDRSSPAAIKYSVMRCTGCGAPKGRA